MRLKQLTTWCGLGALLCSAAVQAEPSKPALPAAGTAATSQRSLLGDFGGEGLFSGDVVALGEPTSTQAPQVIYRYQRAGREVYTNILDLVPEGQRDDAAMDLSRVSLRSELGQELHQELSEQHGALARTEYCVTAREEAALSFLQSLWDDYAPLVVCAAVLLMFLIFTPVALKRMSAPDWARTLTMAIPSLVLAGLVCFSMMKTNAAIVKVRALAKPCETQTFTALASEDNPIGKQAALVSRLREQIASLDALSKLDGRTRERSVHSD